MQRGDEGTDDGKVDQRAVRRGGPQKGGLPTAVSLRRKEVTPVGRFKDRYYDPDTGLKLPRPKRAS